MLQPDGLPACVLGVGSRLIGWLTAGGLATAAALCLPLGLGVVDGHSMEPTLRPGQVFLFEKGRPRELERGQVLLLHWRNSLVVKRLVARAGDTLWAATAPGEHSTAAAMLLLSDRDCAAWKARFPRLNYRRIQVPPGSLFVVGDGHVSLDSRILGTVPESAVVGRVTTCSTGFPREGAVRLRLPPGPYRPPTHLARR